MSLDFNERPYLVVWELTRACTLACRHCRVAAQPKRHPDELTTAECLAAIEQIARARPGLLILTGGDPVLRPDFAEILSCAACRGLRVSCSPSATPGLLKHDFAEWKRLGLARIALSLDGAEPAAHDAFRGVRGSWNWTMQAFEKARAAGLPVQLNTALARQNFGEFEALVARMRALQPAAWNVFLLVPSGRCTPEDLLSGAELEALFARLCALTRDVPFSIKATEGQHYRRVRTQHGFNADGAPEVGDGKGFLLISHTGEICPSGFLPFVAGHIRQDELLEIYRHAEIFQQLRDPNLLKGKCSRCEFKAVCGGSRARAFALSGDAFAEEPCCVYQP